MAAATKASGIPITLVRSESFMIFNSFPLGNPIVCLDEIRTVSKQSLKKEEKSKKNVTLLLWLSELKGATGRVPGRGSITKEGKAKHFRFSLLMRIP